MIDGLQGNENDVWALSARAYILADIPGKHEEAMQIYRQLAAKDLPMSDRYALIYIPLLLGKMEIATEAAIEWTRMWEEGTGRIRAAASEGHEEDLIRIVATGEHPDLNSLEGFDWAFTRQVLGLVALGKGDREMARRYFEEAIQKPYTNIDHYWAEAFLIHMDKDETTWPRARVRPTGPGSRF